MILLTEIASKLENILNGNDGEINILRPVDYDFIVKTQGFHLDHITGKNNNFIPVFISQSGGDFDATPGLNKANYVISVNIYYPVRFKDDFYALGEYLSSCFVAKTLNYGTSTGTCLSNLSIPTFSEIQELDLKEFSTWVSQNYRLGVDMTEMWMAMGFQLYLSHVGSGFIYGNDVTYTLKFTYNGTHYSEDLVWVQSGTGLSNSPISQQLVNVDSYTQSVLNIKNYSKSINVYIRENSFWLTLLARYNTQISMIENLTLEKKYKWPSGNTSIYTYNQVLLAFNENISIGSPLTCTISLGDAYA